MSAPSTPTADAGKDAWSSYNARVQARLEAKQAATERQRQHVKENKILRKISKIIPASWLGGGGGGASSSSSASTKGKYKPTPPASGSDDAAGGFGGGGGAGSSAASAAFAGPPGVGKKE